MAQLFERIPNNVHLSDNRRLQRALGHWLPSFLNWWREMGPSGFQDAHQVYLRTAVSADPEGWAHFDFVQLPEYRWGIFLSDPEPDRRVGFGDFYGQPVWQEVPGEFRTSLRRLIVTQGDTEPASVEQQRMLGHSCPSLYDLRNIFQVNVEEGRHLWAMVYLLHSYFGRDGREEAEGLLQRRSGHPDKPRILSAFNQPIENWLDFYMFTMFTDRDGKYQLLALAESGFDPLSRTTRFMLTEEAHHMSVGETGVVRVVERTSQLMRESKGVAADVRRLGGIDLPTIQKYVNLWFSLSLDLFGGEISSNASNFFASGLKGRAYEEGETEHVALEGTYPVEVFQDGRWTVQDVPSRQAMNAILRDRYVEDCQRACDRWNEVLASYGITDRLRLPSTKFHRQIGVFAGHTFDFGGRPVAPKEFERHRSEWLPSENDQAYIKNLTAKPVFEPGKIANWVAPPKRGINGKPFEFEYVRTEK